MNLFTAPSSIELPTPQQSNQAVAEARRLFQHTLVGWTSDLLILGKRGTLQATWAPPREEAHSETAA